MPICIFLHLSHRRKFTTNWKEEKELYYGSYRDKPITAPQEKEQFVLAS